MARIPQIISRGTVSTVAAAPQPPGGGFAALADIAKVAQEFIRPAAEKSAREAGFNAVYRDENGVLQVDERSVLGGEMAEIHNAAAFSKYLAQMRIDMGSTFTELGVKYQFDPDGFRQAADGYISMLRADERVPAAIKEDLVATASEEASRRFNGLYVAETKRNFEDSETNTRLARDMVADDYVSLFMQGDEKAAEAKYQELLSISEFRANAPYIGETEAQTEAYLRGIRGAAKAARAARQLQDLSGAEAISDEMRAELDAVLKDPDLTPEARDKLYAATQGALKGIDAATFVNAATSDSYAAKAVRVESGGDPNARNDKSSAGGLHQFLASTFVETVRAMQKAGLADWAKGISDEAVAKMRFDERRSSEAFKFFTAQNEAALARNGLPVTDGTRYMAHFFGAGGAITLLKSDPAAKVADLVSPDVIEANPFLANMTVADAINWANRKMTVKSEDIVRASEKLSDIQDAEVRALASSMFAEQIRARRLQEAQSNEDWTTRIEAGDTTVTERGILTDHGLSDKDQADLVLALRKANKDKMEVQQTVIDLNGDTHRFDRFDSKERKRVNEAYTAALGDEDPLSDFGMAEAAKITGRTGFIPPRMVNEVRSAIAGDDAERMARALSFIDQMGLKVKDSYAMYDGAADFDRALADFRFYGRTGSAVNAAQRMIDLRDKPAQGALTKEAIKEAAKGLKPADVISHYRARNVSVESLGSEVQQATLMDEYTRLFTEEAGLGVPADIARERALTRLDRVYGVSEIAGGGVLMMHPPERYAPVVDGSHAWMEEVLTRDATKAAYGDDLEALTKERGGYRYIGGGKWKREFRVPLDRIIVTSDDQTRREIGAGKPPSYKVMVLGDPEHDEPGFAYSGRYVFDASEFADEEAARSKALEAQTDEETANRNERAWYEFTLRKFGEEAANRMLMEDNPAYRLAPPPQE